MIVYFIYEINRSLDNVNSDFKELKKREGWFYCGWTELLIQNPREVLLLLSFNQQGQWRIPPTQLMSNYVFQLTNYSVYINSLSSLISTLY